MQTARDQEIVGWIARIGAAGAEHVQGRFAIGRSQAYARLSGLSNDGLLEHKQLLHRVPGLLLPIQREDRSAHEARQLDFWQLRRLIRSRQP